MIAEACRDLIIIACQAPFQRYRGDSVLHLSFMRDKWSVFGLRFEAVLQRNGGEYLVGNTLTYADILVAHVLTWFVEEVITNTFKSFLLLFLFLFVSLMLLFLFVFFYFFFSLSYTIILYYLISVWF